MMREDVFLITNNPSFEKSIPFSCLEFTRGTALDVLTIARNAVHVGKSLLTHPLYGNLRPHQQPFRSVLLRKEEKLNMYSTVYAESISMIEEAVLLYSSYGSRLLAPDSLPDAVREDYAFVDAELMRESLARYGLLSLSKEQK